MTKVFLVIWASAFGHGGAPLIVHETPDMAVCEMAVKRAYDLLPVDLRPLIPDNIYCVEITDV